MSDERKQQSERQFRKGGEPPAPGREWAKSEQPLMGDGQLGGDTLAQGPEYRNPEGTADTPNPPEESRPQDEG